MHIENLSSIAYSPVLLGDTIYKNFPSHTHLTNIPDSSFSFLVADIFKNTKRTSLLIAKDKEQAAYYYNDLQSILEGIEHNIHFLSDTALYTDTVDTMYSSNLQNKVSILTSLIHNQKIIVTYYECLYERVLTKNDINVATISLHVDMQIDIEDVQTQLLSHNFELVEYVCEPGQISRRGSIIDVFSFSNEMPFRIEFFDDTIESVRLFDIEDQLSIQKMKSVEIIPNINAMLGTQTYTTDTLFSFLSSDTILFIDDTQALLEYWNILSVRIKEDIVKKYYLNTDEISESLKSFSIVQYATHYTKKQYKTVDVGIQKTISFGKNFTLLKEELLRNISMGFLNYIVAEQEVQLQRIMSIVNTDKSLFTPVKGNIFGGFIDKKSKIACYTDHEILGRYHRFTTKKPSKKKQKNIDIADIISLQKGDYVVHTHHGIGMFSGLQTIDIDGSNNTQEVLRILYKDNSVLYVNIHSIHMLSKYRGGKDEPAIDALGTSSWRLKKQKVKNKVQKLAFDIVDVYSQRKLEKGFAFSPDTPLQIEMEATFPYEDTEDQALAIQNVKEDMENSAPMDRLVCGDVGFGKTEVAIRAAFKAINDNKQVAILVPTTILCLQQYKTFAERFKPFSCHVDYISRLRTPKQNRIVLEELKQGKIDLIVGTHTLVSKNVYFKDIGLIIIDEEHKFGVNVKDKIKLTKPNIDILTLTATPIPRTLHFSLSQLRDMSVINTPPPNRKPIDTECIPFDMQMISEIIIREKDRGGQVFFIHNRVHDIQKIATMITQYLPNIRLAIVHGQMQKDILEKNIYDFVDKQYDILLSTTIVESGIDIPSANTIIINDAHTFGLSDLHQMRGRVGRSNIKAFCYLIAPSIHSLSSKSKKRLQIIQQFSALSSGLHIAMRDMDIRGAGDVFGPEQSGFIADIGFELYHKILNEAIQNIKHTKGEKPVANIISHSCTFETDQQAYIPQTYISADLERLKIYEKISKLHTEDIPNYIHDIEDRFGPMPKIFQCLFHIVKLKHLGSAFGFQKITLKKSTLTILLPVEEHFYNSSTFAYILDYVQKHPKTNNLRKKEDKVFWIISNVQTFDDAIQILHTISL